jgi:hypothetical protein
MMSLIIVKTLGTVDKSAMCVLVAGLLTRHQNKKSQITSPNQFRFKTDSLVLAYISCIITYQ